MRLDWIFLPRENPCAKFYILIIIIIIIIIIIVVVVVVTVYYKSHYGSWFISIP